MSQDATRIKVKCRFSYVHVFKPDTMGDDEKPKYSATLLIDKDDKVTTKAIEAAIAAAKIQGKAKWGGKIPANVKVSYRDGDDERPDDEAYANCMFINAKSTTRPGVIGPDKAPLTEDDDAFYSGCYGYASITALPYDNPKGGKGITFLLNNVMKTKDGDRFGSAKVSAEDDFADIDADDLM